MEPIDLSTVPVYPEFYPAINHVMSAIKAIPYIKDLSYFLIQTERNAGEIVDV